MNGGMRKDGMADERKKEWNEEFKNVKQKELLRKVRKDGKEGRMGEERAE